MSDVVIRRCTKDDAEALFALRLEALQTNPEAFGASYEETAKKHNAESYAESIPELDSDNILFCATLEDEIIGMMGFYREKHKKMIHRGKIRHSFVKPSIRGKGIGRKLMQAVMDHAHTCEGLQSLSLTVNTNSTVAIQLYETFGFTTWGTQPDALFIDGQFHAMHWMIYWLNQSK